MLLKRAFMTAVTLMALSISPAVAQNPFATVIEVNEDIITAFELDQRQRFLRIISPANSGAETAREELIDDRLRAQAMRRAGIVLNEEDIAAGMGEFAGRANLTAEEFIKALEARGVAKETFRDFVAVGIGWRDLVRGTFGNRVDISEAEVDRALAAANTGSGVRVLLSEIIMPAPPERADAVLARAEQISQTKSLTQFSSYARQYSATPTRDRGGRLNWTPISNLPPALRPQILALAVGDVTQPIALQNAVGLFQLRGIQETDAPQQSYAAIEYAQYLIPGGRTEAALAEAERIRNRVDVCDDLYGVAHGQPEEVLIRESKKPDEIPQGIAIELAKLDRNEVSTTLTTQDGSALIFLMMCGRTPDLGEDVNRDAIVQRLRSERLGGLAESLLEELRADARIVEK